MFIEETIKWHHTAHKSLQGSNYWRHLPDKYSDENNNCFQADKIRKMVVPKLLSTCMRYSPVKHQSFTPNGSDRVFSLIIVSGSFILYECAHIQTCPLISHWFTIGSPMMITCQCNRTYQC